MGQLVLSRKEGDTIVIDESTTITVHRIRGGKVRIGIDAPRSSAIRRGELEPRGAARPTDVDGEHVLDESPAGGSSAVVGGGESYVDQAAITQVAG